MFLNFTNLCCELKTCLVFFIIHFIYLFFLLLVLLVKTIPNGEYSNLVFSTTLGLYSKSSPVKYLYLPRRFFDFNADILAARLSK